MLRFHRKQFNWIPFFFLVLFRLNVLVWFLFFMFFMDFFLVSFEKKRKEKKFMRSCLWKHFIRLNGISRTRATLQLRQIWHLLAIAILTKFSERENNFQISKMLSERCTKPHSPNSNLFHRINLSYRKSKSYFSRVYDYVWRWTLLLLLLLLLLAVTVHRLRAHLHSFRSTQKRAHTIPKNRTHSTHNWPFELDDLLIDGHVTTLLMCIESNRIRCQNRSMVNYILAIHTAHSLNECEIGIGNKQKNATN